MYLLTRPKRTSSPIPLSSVALQHQKEVLKNEEQPNKQIEPLVRPLQAALTISVVDKIAPQK